MDNKEEAKELVESDEFDCRPKEADWQRMLEGAQKHKEWQDEQKRLKQQKPPFNHFKPH